MRCPECDAKGVMQLPSGAAMPCPLCGGCGVAHCCDGDTMPEFPTGPRVDGDKSNAALMRHFMGDAGG